MGIAEEYKDMLRTASAAGAFAIFKWNLASVLSPFIDGWQEMEIKRKEFRNLINPIRHGKMPQNLIINSKLLQS